MWQEKLTFVVGRTCIHPAWGMPHFARVYETAQQLTAAENHPADDDVLLAAGYLHDIGAFEPYRLEGVDHAEQSAVACEEILGAIGFPSEKISLVQDAIRGHMFYSQPADEWEAIVLHDADTLDFLGMVGIMRIFAIVGRDDWAPDLPSAVRRIQKFMQDLPGALHTETAREWGEQRKGEMEEFLRKLAD